MSQETEKTGRRKAAFQTPAHEDRFSASGRLRSGLDYPPHGTPAALREADDFEAYAADSGRFVDPSTILPTPAISTSGSDRLSGYASLLPSVKEVPHDLH